MENITFKKITYKNMDQVIALSDRLTDYQKTCVAQNINSLAEAYVHYKQAWPRAIYLGKELIGFIMVDLNNKNVPKEDRPLYYLWRFMIVKEHQSKGYGRQALDLLLTKCRRDHIKTLYTSCATHGNQPYDFYIKYGFMDTGLNDGEQILKLYL